MIGRFKGLSGQQNGFYPGVVNPQFQNHPLFRNFSRIAIFNRVWQ
jgi:hypothetical protein